MFYALYFIFIKGAVKMITEMIYKFRQKLQNDFVLGPFCKTSDAAFIEIAGYSGFDFVIIDLEHGPNSVETAQNLIRAAQVAGVFPIVRVKENNNSVIGEVLDIGTGGIQIPQITSAEDVRNIIRVSKFSPYGMRGLCRFVRAADYSAVNRFEYIKNANDALIVLQLESINVINEIDRILNIQGFDIIFIGPYDLSQSLGIPGQINNPKVIEKMTEIVEICKQYGIYTGTFADTIENAERWKKAGVKFISYNVDVGIFHEACSSIVNTVRKKELLNII
jgi:4-hydroxy-2-oxoheptanedioate aldolase